MDLNKPYIKYIYDYVTLDVALLKNFFSSSIEYKAIQPMSSLS